MPDRHSIYWDPDRAILHVYQGPGLWTDADFDAYQAALVAALENAPGDGFDLLLDQSDTIAQRPEITARRNDTLNELITRGMMRAIIIVPRAVMQLQTGGIISDSGADSQRFVMCKTRDEALASLAQT